MPSLRPLGALVLCAALSAGCGLAKTDSDGASSTADSGGSGQVASAPTMLTYADPALVPGLTTESISGESRRPHLYISYPIVAGATKLNERLRADLDQAAKKYVANTKADSRFPAPELNVEWQLTAASPDVIGVRLRTGEFHGVRWANSTRTLWYDRPADQVIASVRLVTDLNKLATLVKRHMDLDPALDGQAVYAQPSLFDSLDFNSRGDLVVEFDDYQVAPGSLGRSAIAIPRKDAEPLLSPFGQRVRDAVARVKPMKVPETAPSPGASGRYGTAPITRAHGTDCSHAKCVALTFDDGPGPGTARVLDALGSAKATFFTIGANAIANPDLLRRMRALGHEIANHTWSHRDLTTMPSSRIFEQLSQAQGSIHQLIGQTPTLARAPYGATDPQVSAVAKELGLALIDWSVDPEDWRGSDPERIAERTVEGAQNGSIILLHDTAPATAQAVPQIVRGLTARGFTLVTVSELYGGEHLVAGRTYTAGRAALVSRGGQPLP